MLYDDRVSESAARKTAQIVLDTRNHWLVAPELVVYHAYNEAIVVFYLDRAAYLDRPAQACAALASRMRWFAMTFSREVFHGAPVYVDYGAADGTSNTACEGAVRWGGAALGEFTKVRD